MNDLCADIGYKSINHVGEELCGDHVDVVEESENSTVIVLADGLGSGVKASILSTLTSKIISTMMAAGLPIEECVSTIAGALPVCSVRGVAYSTFTIIHLLNNQIAEIIQYDNPHVIVIRNYEQYDYPKTEMNIGGKKIPPTAFFIHTLLLRSISFYLFYYFHYFCVRQFSLLYQFQYQRFHYVLILSQYAFHFVFRFAKYFRNFCPTSLRYRA